jgi:hypothetical protein
MKKSQIKTLFLSMVLLLTAGIPAASSANEDSGCSVEKTGPYEATVTFSPPLNQVDTEIWRKINAGNFGKIAQVPWPQTQYVDSGLPPDSDVSYRTKLVGGLNFCEAGSIRTDPPQDGPYRAFSDSSEWNKPLPADAPVHPNSAAIINEIRGYANGPSPRIVRGAWAEPMYFADAADPVCTPPGSFAPVHVPPEATPAPTSDAQLTIFDLAGGTVVKFWQATRNGNCFNFNGISQYELASNGLHKDLPESDSPNNFGHRGYPPALHGARVEEVQAGVIRHVIKVALDKTAECHHYPGQGHESGKGGVLTCEGLILRIKPSIDLSTRGLTPGMLVIAEAMQDYGVVIGDTGGVMMAYKVEANQEADWDALGVTTLGFNGKVTIDDFEVIQAGYHRP